MVTCTKGPHDFGMYNNLKTICHVWEGRDGYRYQATQHINSSKNIHGSHPWDYDGECDEYVPEVRKRRNRPWLRYRSGR